MERTVSGRGLPPGPAARTRVRPPVTCSEFRGRLVRRSERDQPTRENSALARSAKSVDSIDGLYQLDGLQLPPEARRSQHAARCQHPLTHPAIDLIDLQPSPTPYHAQSGITGDSPTT